MTDSNVFRPYKISHQSNSSLELKAGTSPTLIRAALLAGPVILLVLGIVLYTTKNNPRFLYFLPGLAFLELIIFSFIKLPGDLRMDNLGFTLKQVSIKGTREIDYLWSDVDRIRWRLIHGKGGHTLAFDAVLKEGKKLRLLNFQNFNTKKQSAAEISSVIAQISRKPVTEK